MLDQTKIKPDKVLYKKHLDILFVCNSFVPSTTIWYFNNGPLPKNARGISDEKNKLFIIDATPKNLGFYECIGTTEWAAGYFSAYGLVKLKGKTQMSQV